MIFPFSVNFNESLKTTITSENKEQVLQYIKKSILEDKADNVVVGEMQVSYKGSTSNWRGSSFANIGKKVPFRDLRGVFNLLKKKDKWFLNYQVNIRRLFISTAILIFMGAILQILDGSWWVGIVAFFWLFGANYIIISIVHKSIATNIATGIDDLIYYKEHPIEDNEDKEKLKSWF